MASDKIEDGVAKLLNKGDVLKVATKGKATEVAEAETTLMECMEIATALGGITLVTKAVGSLFVRVGLKLTVKEKQGRERVQYTMDQIRSMFLKEVGVALGKR